MDNLHQTGCTQRVRRGLFAKVIIITALSCVNARVPALITQNVVQNARHVDCTIAHKLPGISVPAPFSDRSGARARAQPANVLSNLRESFAYFLITANRNRAETFRPSRIHASRAIAASVIAHHVRIAHKNQCFVNDMSLNHTTTTTTATAAQFPNYRNYEYNILVRLAMCTPKTCSRPRVAGLVTTSRSTHKHTRCSVARAVSCRAGTSERERTVRSR